VEEDRTTCKIEEFPTVIDIPRVFRKYLEKSLAQDHPDTKALKIAYAMSIADNARAPLEDLSFRLLLGKLANTIGNNNFMTD
jgi:hypothetical protein